MTRAPYFSKLKPQARALMETQIADSLRLCTAKNPDQNTLLLAEVCAELIRYFPTEELIALLTRVTESGHNNVNCPAVYTLLFLHREVPAGVISALAEDLVYAGTVYRFLKALNRIELFPEAYRTPEYIAKSEMVRWLCYPTELGGPPDAIEYVGEIRRIPSMKRYYIFKFRSESSSLDEKNRGKWLWAGPLPIKEEPSATWSHTKRTREAPRARR